MVTLGALVCGIINHEVPRHVAVGNAIQNSLLLVSSCPNGVILVSQQIHDAIAGMKKFQLVFYRPFIGLVSGSNTSLSIFLC